MPGKFNGLTDSEWELLRRLLPDEKKATGRPPAEARSVLNTIFYLLITGCRWCDVPIGKKWAKKSSAHRRLGKWQKNGTFASLKASLLGAAHLAGKIDWQNASVDGSFAAGKGGGEGVEYGFKGKGVLTHALVDGNGNILSVTTTGAGQSEREQVEELLDCIDVNTGRRGRRRSRPATLELDKGYDSQELRKKNKGTRNSTQNSKKKMAKKKTTTRKKNRQTEKPMESGTELRVDSEKIQKTGY
jgi:transposase